MILPPIERIAELLGGEASGSQVRAPGPGHSAGDRSLSVLLDASAPEGFVVNSFAGDDALRCRDHVRDRLGLPPFEARKNKANGEANGKWSPLAEYVYRDANGEPYLLVRKYLDGDGKKQFPQFHWDGTQWVKGKPAGSKIPYRLPELLAAPTAVVYFCEGEKDADNLAGKACVVATSASEGASAKWVPELTQYFKDRRVVILPDADEPGRKHADKVAEALYEVAASVKVVDLYPDRSDGHDVTDWLKHDADGARLFEAVKAAPDWQPADEPVAGDGADESGIATEIERLAKLTAIKYEQERKAAAEALGLRTSILDQLVQAERARLGDDGDSGMQGRAISFPEPEPWPQPVDGAALLDEISKAIGEHIIMPETSRDTCALWAAHTFLTDATMISPRLAITSPTRGCGKTTALDVISQLVLRPLSAANVSASAIFRVVEGFRPTLMIDEADSFLRDNEELRGVLNSGHRKGGAVLRNVGDDHEPRSFSTYSACAIALIGQLPPTLTDRSVPITLTRRKRDEAITPFRLDRVDHLVVLARKLARWTTDNAVAIAATEPEIPAGIYNRAADNWRPLLAIAEVAGGKWLERGQAAALKGVATDNDDASLLELLLRDIRDIFAKRAANKVEPVDRIPSAVLAEALAEIEGRPWAEYGRSEKPITPGKLARLLKPLVIVPENIRIGDKVSKGYLLERFKEAFARYLASEGASEPLQRYKADEMGTSELFQTATAGPDVAGRKCEKPNNGEPCSVVADREGGQGEGRDVCAHCGLPGDLVEVFFSNRPMVRLHRECKKSYRQVLDEGEKDLTGSVEDAPEDRTCAQCNGEIDGTERLVSVSGRAVWLHLECERFWLAALDEGRCPERVSADPAASSRSFRIKGPAPPDSVCVCCYRDGAEAVLKIASTEAGSKSETLHEKCAAQWFAALRDFENGPSDDDNSWQEQA